MWYTILLRSLIVYFIIFIILKFMGKREIGKLSLFDFVVLLLIADISVIGIDNNHFFYYLIPIFALTIIQKILALISLKFTNTRKILDGSQSNIIINGRLNLKEMKKQNYNIDDLLTQLRLKDVRSISEVEYLILETNGNISVFLKNNIPNNIIPFPVIISGRFIEENILIHNLTLEKIKSELCKIGYENEKNILYANYENNTLYIPEIYESQ